MGLAICPWRVRSSRTAFPRDDDRQPIQPTTGVGLRESGWRNEAATHRGTHQKLRLFLSLYDDVFRNEILIPTLFLQRLLDTGVIEPVDRKSGRANANG